MTSPHPTDGTPPPWLTLLAKWQTDTNTLATVTTEAPALRPALTARIEAMDGDT